MLRTAVKTCAGWGRTRSQPLFERLLQIAASGMNFGNWEHEKNGELPAIRYVRDRLAGEGRPAMIFDVGANAGQYATALLQCFGDKAVIHAFEPSARTFESLKASIPPGAAVHPHHFGLGHRDEVVELFFNNPGDQVATVYPQGQGDVFRRHNSETITIRTLDGVAAEMGIDRIDLLKIDVEGHELRVLEGARGLLEKQAIRFIQFEFNETNIDSRTFFRDFFNLLDPRYRIFRIVRDGLSPIPAYSPRHELFVGAINYLAERR